MALPPARFKRKPPANVAAQERVQRVQDALTQVQDLRSNAKPAPKVRETRPGPPPPTLTLRNMKMPDGGFRPGYNVQFATATVSGLIAGVDVTNQGTDAGLMDPMLEQVEQRTGRVPEEHLTDGGFATIEDIEKVTARGTTVFTPIKDEAKKQAAGIDGMQPRPKDSPAIGDWRQRMGTEEAAHDLQAARRDGGMDQRPGAQPELLQGTRTQPAQGAGNRPVVRLVDNLLCARRLRAERAQAAAKAQSATAEAWNPGRGCQAGLILKDRSREERQHDCKKQLLRGEEQARPEEKITTSPRGNASPDALRRGPSHMTPQAFSRDAERPGVRSHAERGNEESFILLSRGPPGGWARRPAPRRAGRTNQRSVSGRR